MVVAQAKKLDMFCLQGVDNKAKVLTDYCENFHFKLSAATYVGNDISDLEVMKLAGTTFLSG